MGIWALPGAKQLRQSATINTLLRLGHGQHWGRFDSRTSAENFLRNSKTATYNDDDIVQINLDSFRDVHLFDWPVIFFLQKCMRETDIKVITDFGGHVGAKYYAYRDIIDFPPDLVWQVVDVPAVCREGRRRSGQDHQAPTYYENVATAPACDVLLCSGSLPYANDRLDEIIDKMPASPDIIILNKVSVSNQEFYTLEAFGNRRMPHRIMTIDYIENIRERMGYRKLAHWDIPHRKYTVSHQTGVTNVELIGQVWQKK